MQNLCKLTKSTGNVRFCTIFVRFHSQDVGQMHGKQARSQKTSNSIMRPALWRRMSQGFARGRDRGEQGWSLERTLLPSYSIASYDSELVTTRRGR